MTDPSQLLFLFGPGYSARALAALWPGPVRGTYRSEASFEALKTSNIQPVSITEPSDLSAAVHGAHILISAPPNEDGCPAWHAIGEYASSAASVTYLSTTGVYGDLSGGWAMEWSPVNPSSLRAKRRADAEQSWASAGANIRIVRLPGIYGPGRSAFDRLRAGRARRIVKPGQVFSRIHVDDIASGLLALIQSGAYGAFNLCDDYAAPPQDVIAYAAELLGMPPPPEIAFEGADLSAMARSFYSECKRVSNAKVKAATHWRPLYPTYREGLSAILALDP
ncbi:MAG: NAD-dependent epimerase/dehydratase family protein [Pseudomonadota bacterium]